MKLTVVMDGTLPKEKVECMMGIKVAYASREAEEACTNLCNVGMCDAVLSKDTDCLAMNCKELILGVDKDVVTYVSTEDVKLSLGISSKQLLELCILCGNDFNGVEGVFYPVPFEGLKMLKHKYGDLKVDECVRMYGRDGTTKLRWRNLPHACTTR